MKNEILDDIFKDKLRAELQEGEIVFWDGKPRFNNISLLKTGGLLFLFFGIHILNVFSSDYKLWMVITYIILLILAVFDLFFRQNKTRYLITNHRIIFQLPKNRKVKYHSIPLNQLEKIAVKKEGKDNGVIFLTLKKPFKTDIQTINIKASTLRKEPTLELIDNVDEVAEIIRNGMKEKL